MPIRKRTEHHLEKIHPEQNRGYPHLQRSKVGQDSGQMSGFDAREAADQP